MNLSQLSRITAGIALVFSCQVAAQNNHTIDPSLSTEGTTRKGHTTQLQKSSSTPIWSEDFSNGIPSTWNNMGFDGNLQTLAGAQWEYRGPNTTPDISVGTRGPFSPGDSIASPTQSNGFIIFDSSFLDNGGNAQNIGGGSAPSPHIGTLTTDVIDLSNENAVVLEFYSYARVFFANFVVEYSIDGGQSWPYSDTIYTDATLGVNNYSGNAELIQRNVSSYIGGESNVKIRFVFDGRPGNANGNGYYYWMIDDLAIVDLPAHVMEFTDQGAAVKHDLLYNNSASNAKYGNISLGETRPIHFDANVVNFGGATQTNVQLQVDVYDPLGANHGTYLSSPVASLTTGQIANYTQLNAGSFTPIHPGVYNIVYSAISDSINYNSAYTPASDTFQLYVNDTTWSLDFGGFDNTIGTPNIGDDGSSIASRFEVQQDETVRSVDIFLSNATAPGGVVEITIYDSTGFTFINGFPTQPLAYQQITVTNQHINQGFIRADFTSTSPSVLLDESVSNGYYVVVTFFSNAGLNPILLRNDQTFPQPTSAAMMYYTLSAPRWYTGFTNSLTVNAPWIRLNSYPTQCTAVINLGEIKRACGPYTAPSGTVYTASATGIVDSVGPVNGTPCSTIYQFDLDLDAEGSLDLTACSGAQTTLPSGKIVTGVGSFKDTVVAAAGCDSIINVNITPLSLNVNINRSGDTLITNQSSGFTYQWIECTGANAGPISGETNASFTVTANGEYAVVVDNGNGCVDTSACFLVDDISLNEEQPNDFNIYPVPASGYVDVEITQLLDVERIEILDLSGQVVRSVHPNGHDIVRIATSDLSNGVYLVRINTKSNSNRVRRFNVVH